MCEFLSFFLIFALLLLNFLFLSPPKYQLTDILYTTGTRRQGQLLKHDQVRVRAGVRGKSVRYGDDVLVPSGTYWPDSKILEL